MSDLLRLLRLWRPQTPWILASIAISLVATLAAVGLMAVSGWFITAMAAAGIAGVSMNYFTPAAIIRALAILRTGGRYADRLISHEATFRLLGSLRGHVFARLEPLVPGAVGDLRSGDLTERLRGDIDRLELVFLRLVAPVCVAVLSSAVVVAVLAHWDGRLAAAVALALVCAGLVLPTLAMIAGRGAAQSITAISAEMRARLVDDLGGLTPLQVTGADRRRFAALEARMVDLVAAEARFARVESFGRIGVGLVGDLAAVAVLVVGVPLVRDATISGPDLTMATLAALAVFEAFVGMPAAFAGLPGTLASARRLFALLDLAPAVVDPEYPQVAPERCDLTLTGVCLDRGSAGRRVLHDIDLDIPQGRRVAIIGPSGAGKSSLADLLVRFRDPSAGEIRLGGVALPDLAAETIRARITLVGQSAHLFTATIAENLRIARPAADDDALWRVLEAARLAVTVRAMPQGLATPIGVAGARLSGGEARRLVLARALLSDAPVLVLDEPTEGLDPRTEREVLDDLIDTAEGRTIILLTHRTAGLDRMDEIITLRDGRIADRAPVSRHDDGDGIQRFSMERP